MVESLCKSIMVAFCDQNISAHLVLELNQHRPTEMHSLSQKAKDLWEAIDSTTKQVLTASINVTKQIEKTFFWFFFWFFPPTVFVFSFFGFLSLRFFFVFV